MRLLTPCILVLTGCSLLSTTDSSSISDADLAKVSYSLHLTRASLTGQEFEQYKALPQGVFMECGTVRRGRAEVSEQQIESPSAERQREIRIAAAELLQESLSDQAASYDPPGNASAFTDPGRYTLTIVRGSDKAEIKTSFDWVERKQTLLAAKLHAFTRLIRGATAHAPCRNEEFYGVGR